MDARHRMPLKEKLNPAHTALIVIDIQKDFCGPKGFRGDRGGDLSMMEPLIDRLLPTIEAAKNAGVLTLYTKKVYDRARLNDLQKEQYDLDGAQITCDIATEGHEFYRLSPPKRDVYVKYNYNAFSNQDLVARLRGSGIKTLVIAGVDSFYCVETAIRNGFDLGYKVVVPTDLVGCSGKRRDMQERTLWLVDHTFGVLTDSARLIDIWENSRDSSH